MTWFEFMQTEQFNEMAKKMAEARAAHIVDTLVDAHKKMTEAEAAKESAETEQE